VGHKFSLVLSREITNDESAILQEAGCAGAVFMTDSHPTNADVTVTKIDFHDTASPSLVEAIETALEAVKTVPDLTVPGLMVPAQPADEEALVEEAPVQESEAAAGENTVARKSTSRKSAPRESAAKKAGTPVADNTPDTVEAGVVSD
jgi:hypothetical protein